MSLIDEWARHRYKKRYSSRSKAGCMTPVKRSCSSIEFTLNGEAQVVDGRLARTTLLEYLREVRQKTGTKEGCGTGDCGACMVAIDELGDDCSDYLAVNACLRLVGSLAGRRVVTVEHLTDSQSSQHPVQRALADCHAAQCGFCTPGFVMSLFALWPSIGTRSDDEIQHALSGNLCRCTGYRPILDAARRLRTMAGEIASLESSESAPIQFPTRPGRRRPARFAGAPGFVAPRSLRELQALLTRHSNVLFVAGGTDVVPRLRDGEFDERTIVLLGELGALRRLSVKGDRIVVGATTPLSKVFSVLVNEYPPLAEFVRRFASVPITNVATLGGNVATGSPVGDTIPLLMCLDAVLVMRRDGRRRRVSIDDFYLGSRRHLLRSREFIEAIELARPQPREFMRAYKVAKRFEQDTSSVVGAFRVVLDDGRITAIRIAFGGLADRPMRARRTEDRLLGRTWNRSAIDAARQTLDEEVHPISDHRGTAQYRRDVAKNLLLKWYLELTDDKPTSIWRQGMAQ